MHGIMAHGNNPKSSTLLMSHREVGDMVHLHGYGNSGMVSILWAAFWNSLYLFVTIKKGG